MRGPAPLALLLLTGWSASALAQLEPQPRPDDEAIPPAPLPPPELERGPELVAGVDPIYPEEAHAAGRGGDVVLRIVIDEQGLVERLDVITGAGLDLDWAAMGAASNFVFTPALFCLYARPADPDAPRDAPPEQRCGQPGKVAIDYRTTFQITEEQVEVPIEPVDEVSLVEGVLNFEGVVREAATKDPLEGAEVTVEIERPGAAPDAPVEERYDLRTTHTDEAGRFSYRGIPAGNHRVTFTLSGYEAAFVDETFAEKERTELVVYLRPIDANKFETVVRRRRAQKDVAKVALTRDEVRRVPGTFGDPLRVIENLPGLARAPFVGGALIVRGANPDDTGVYFDGVEIPLLYHFGGLTSVVNAEFLEDIAFYPGGFGAYYGRATAGIVDVTSRKLKLKGFRGYAEVDLIDSGFFFAGPVQIGELPKITFAAAARRSYIDGILPVLLDAFIGPDGQGIVAAPVYWDYQTKVELSPTDGQTLSLFLFGSDDDLSVIQRGVGSSGGLDIGFHTTFHRLVGSWQWRLSPGLTHSFAPYAGVTRVSFDAGNSGDQGPQVGLSAVIDTWVWGARDDVTLVVDDMITLRGGLDYVGNTFGVEFDVPLPIEIGSFPRVFPRIEGSNQTFGTHGMTNAAAVWLEAELTPAPWLKLVPGVRAEHTLASFFADELADGTTSDPADVALFHIDPRLTARLDVVRGTTLKAAAGIYRQAPSGEQVSPEGGNPALVEPRAVQLIGGVEQRLTRDINLDAQLYLTNRDLLVQSTGRVRSSDDGSGEVDPLFYDNGGRGNTLGAELMLRHEITEHFYGWIAYTLSRTVEDVDDNDDRWWLTDFDQTHILTIVAQTTLPWAFTLGARFRVVSGSPTNLPLGSVHDLDTTNYQGLGTTPQSSRLPTFHQLDLRIDRKFVFDTFSFTAYLDLLNVYNQANAEGFLTDYRSREQEPIPSLPILPVIGLSGEF